MEFLHRKILHKSTKIIMKDDLDLQPPPKRPPPVSSNNHSSRVVSPFLIFMFCGLAFFLLFISYLIFIKRYESRRRLRNHQINNSTLVNEDVGPVIDHPIWLINTVGLDQSQIDSIHVFKFKKDESSVIEGGTTDCSVCLSEFEDDESLRLLPKCNHAFHVPCIDTWLRSHKNCPLCRAPIFNNPTNHQTTHHATTHEESNTSDQETETQVVVVVGSESIDDNDDVVEVENNNIGGIEKNFGMDETGVRVPSDLGDHHHHHRVHSVELLAMRRSFSNSQLVNNMPLPKQKLNGSSSSKHIRSKVMKSSSIGHSSSRKASSVTTKCAAHNRSY